MNNFLLFILLCCVRFSNSELRLTKVLLLSRHNVRTPLSKTLCDTSPRKWPAWREKPGYLTPKGALLEGYMGEYFSQWLRKEGILTENCPNNNDFFVYANIAQRTMLSAKSFVAKAFPNCSIKIHHAKSTDPIFNPVIHNTSLTFLADALKIMKDQIKHLNLNSSLEEMEQILNYKQSNNCIENGLCDLVTDINTAIMKTGSKPNVNGPLKVTKSAIDSFIMENYEGLKTKEVAWGLLNTDKKWRSVMDIFLNYHDIIFNNTIIAQDISRPLIKYMSNIFLESVPKVTLLTGHDANMYTILNAMGFKWYKLRNQYENTPVGGKIVFQKWSSNLTDYLKIDYVYQGTEQMRDGIELSLHNPPLFEPLELNECPLNKNGFCLWNDFEKLLKRLNTSN